jgi:transposase
MSIVGGLDIHRKQITYDYLDKVTGQVCCGQIAPADRRHLALWLRRFDGLEEVDFAAEACTGWRYVVEELNNAGVRAHLAEPADTAAARDRKKRPKTDKADAKLLRALVEDDRVPECPIPPAHVLDCRALLETYHDLRIDHTAWIQRIHAVLFHHGAPHSGEGGINTAAGRQRLTEIASSHLSPAGQVQITTALRMLQGLEVELDALRRRLTQAARRLHGAKVLHQQLDGIGPITALALTCWLGGAGRFSSSRQAVRFCGLDVTVYSSAGKRSPGHLSGQGPPMLRWAV